MRICNRCKIEKELSYFPKDKTTSSGYGYKCKECYKIFNKKYYSNNSEQYHNYYKNNKENKQEYYQQNSLKYNIENKEKIKEYRKQNKGYYRAWVNNKRKNDLNFKIRHILQTRIVNELKGKKEEKTSTLLGGTISQIKQYLESQFKPEMNWNNHGKIWEIDHIIGCCNFNLTDIEQQKQCFHYTNLQPLFKTTEIAESFGYKGEIGNKNKKKKVDQAK
jgi:hypothetical protein